MVFKYFSTTCFDSDEFASSETGFVEVNSIQSAVIESTEPDIALWRGKDGSFLLSVVGNAQSSYNGG